MPSIASQLGFLAQNGEDEGAPEGGNSSTEMAAKRKTSFPLRLAARDPTVLGSGRGQADYQPAALESGTVVFLHLAVRKGCQPKLGANPVVQFPGPAVIRQNKVGGER